MENPFELILERLDRIEKAIEKLNVNKIILVEETTLDLEDLSKYLNITKPGLYGMVHRKVIPHYKFGKKLSFKKSEIDNWIISKRVKTSMDIEEAAMDYLRRNPRKF